MDAQNTRPRHLFGAGVESSEEHFILTCMNMHSLQRSCLRFSGLLALCLLLLTQAGCPVYGNKAPAQQDCSDSSRSATTRIRDTTCFCDNVKALMVGEPIPGMDENAVPRRGGRLRMVADSNVRGLNRLLYISSTVKNIILHDVYETLIRQDPRDYHFRPELATRWEHNDQATEWTFHLREGVRWHDGEPFTARDVVFTFDAMFNPGNRTGVVRSDWDGVLLPEGGYEALDDHTFVMRLERPVGLFLPNLESLGILPEHVFSRGDFNTHPANRAPVGTGPFRFKEWNEQGIVLERNPSYWGRPAYLDEVFYRFVLDRDTAFSLAKRGEIDFIERLQPYQREEGLTPEDLKEFRVIDLLPSIYSFLIYNVENPRLSDRRVRRAITHLLNLRQMQCAIYRCMAVPTTGPIPLHHPAHDHNLKPYPYDPELAAQLLTEAGWEDRDHDGVREKEIDGQVIPLSFTFLLTQSSKNLGQLATMLQNAARRVGVDIRLSKLDWSVFQARLESHDFELAAMQWSLNHDMDLYPILNSKGPQNMGLWKNEEFDLLTDKARFIIEEPIRNLILRRAQQIIHEELPYTSTFAMVRSTLIRANVQGVYTSDQWYQEYDMWIDDPSFPEVPPEKRHPGSIDAPPYDETGR